MPCMRVVCRVRGLGPKPYVKTKCFVSYSFDSISGAHKSKGGHL